MQAQACGQLGNSWSGVPLPLTIIVTLARYFDAIEYMLFCGK
jgi:hypothetical protein